MVLRTFKTSESNAQALVLRALAAGRKVDWIETGFLVELPSSEVLLNVVIV